MWRLRLGFRASRPEKPILILISKPNLEIKINIWYQILISRLRLRIRHVEILISEPCRRPKYYYPPPRLRIGHWKSYSRVQT